MIGGLAWRRLDRDFDQMTLNYTLPTVRIYHLSDVLDPSAGTQAPNGTDPVFINQAAYLAYITANGTFSQEDAVTTDYALKEDVLAGHMAATWTIPGIRVMAGVRVEKTNVDDVTASTISGVITPQTRRFDYTEFLPNVQVAFQPASNVKVRLAYTETLARVRGVHPLASRASPRVAGMTEVQGVPIDDDGGEQV